MIKKWLLIALVIMPMVIFAQSEDDQCAFIQGMYEKKVEESVVLRGEIKRLYEDSLKHETTITNLLQDTAKMGQSMRNCERQLSEARQNLKQTNTMLALYRNLNAQMQEQLKRCDAENVQRNEDSIQSLCQRTAILEDSIAHLSKQLSDNSTALQKKQIEIEKLMAVTAYLDERFAKKSVDVLYETTDTNELNMCVNIYSKLGKELPENIKLTLACFIAEDITTEKYDKVRIDRAIAILPQNTKAGKTIAKHLQNYGTVNSDANKLWNKIKTEVCSEVIPNDDFTQIQKKRQIWQRTQKFLNQYPTLSTDYPYIADLLQSMLRKIWLNANNFNTLPNPFE